MDDAQSRPDTPTDTAPDTTPKPRRKRRLLIVGVVLLGLLVLLVALAPTLLSTGPGNKLAQNLASGQLNGEVTKLNGLSLGWFSPISVKAAEVKDTQGRVVVEAAEIETGYSLLEAIRGSTDYGRVTGRVNLPVVEVFADGTTNLDKLAPPSEEPFDLSALVIDADLTLTGTVQYVGDGPDTVEQREGGTGDDSPPAKFSLEGLKLAAGNGPMKIDAPLSLSVKNQPAGTISLSAEADPSTFEQDVPTAKLMLALSEVDAGALSPMLVAFGSPTLFGGIFDGSFDVDTTAGTLGGTLTARNFKAHAAGDDGSDTTYASDTVQLDLAGNYDGSIGAIDELKLTTDDGQVVLSMKADTKAMLAPAGEDEAAMEQMAVLANAISDLALKVDLPGLNIEAAGENIASTTGTFDVDLAPAREFAGAFVDLSSFDDTTLTGKLAGTLGLENTAAGELLKFDADGQSLVYQPEGSDAVELTGVDLTVRAGPFTEMGTRFTAGEMFVPRASVQLTASTAAGNVVELDALATGIDGDQQQITSLQLNKLLVPDYQRLADLTKPIAELPAVEKNLNNVNVSGTMAYASSTLQIGSLDVRANNAIIAQINGDVLLDDRLAARDVVIDVPDAAAAKALASSFGVDLGEYQPTGGSASVTVNVEGDQAADDLLATLGGSILMKLSNFAAEGMLFSGEVPVDLSQGVATVTKPAGEALSLNGSPLNLLGIRYELEDGQLRIPAGQIVTDLPVNKIIAGLVGSYQHFAFTDADEVGGLLSFEVTETIVVNLDDPTAAGGLVGAANYSIEDLKIENDVIGQLAQSLTDDLTAGVRAQTRNIPGVAARVDAEMNKLQVTDEVKKLISDIEGSVPSATVRFADGAANVSIDLSARDPRASVDGERPTDTYDVSFVGTIGLSNKKQALAVTLPPELLDKWIGGEEEQKLAELLGDNPIQKIAGDGLTLRFGGTTADPNVNANDFIRNRLPGLANTLIRSGVENELKKGAKDILDGLFK